MIRRMRKKLFRAAGRDRKFGMDLKEIMEKRHFVVAGDTLNEEKYACKIKHALQEHGYQVQCVGKELPSLKKAAADPAAITGPRKLGVYGATYIWAIFRGLGII